MCEDSHCDCHGQGDVGHHESRCACLDTALARFLQPCLLMLLAGGDSHGYSLLERLPEVGHLDSPPDPATVYKALRALDGDGAVKSDWDTSGSGPAKRVYSITREGEELLGAWVAVLKRNRESIDLFLEVFQERYGK